MESRNKFIWIKVALPIFVIIYLLLSYFIVNWVWNDSKRKTSEHALLITETIATGINGEMFKQLRGLPEDVGTVPFESIKQRFLTLVKVHKGVKFIYTYTKRDGKLIFTADSEPVTSADYTPPGEVYTEADPEYYRPFVDGKTIITKPVIDRWGTWVSILMPIKDKASGEILGVLGVDYPASKWQEDAVRSTTQTFIILLVFFLLILTICGLVLSNIIRQRHEKKLFEREQSYQNLFNGSRDGLVIVDIESRFIDANPAYCQMLGYTLEELKQKPDFYKITPEKWWDYEREEIWNKKLLKQGYSGVYEKEYIKKDGTIFPVELQAYVLKDNDGSIRYLWAATRDITERKKMEQHTLKTQRLESIGILAGGIAHDFNNLLGGIFGHMDLAKSYAQEKNFDRVEYYLSKSLTMFNRAKDLSLQLLTFSKGGQPVTKQQSLVPIIKRSCEFSLSGSNVKLNMIIMDDLWDVSVDENQIGQAIDNIVINAKQAMPAGGEVSVLARNIHRNEGVPIGLTGEQYVCISIKDTGIGIPPEYISKVFDPFFTTKHKGSGLGLATVYSIIKRHDGEIEVKSELQKGSTFSIYLPACLSRVDEKKEIPLKDFKYHGNVLLMDDEEDLLDLFACNLREIGCVVTCATNGEAALELFMKAKDSINPFDLLILDLTIPGGMGGKELIGRIRRLDNTVVAIVSSGYSDDPVMARPKEHGFHDSIAKPYLKEGLIEVIRRNVGKS